MKLHYDSACLVFSVSLICNKSFTCTRWLHNAIHVLFLINFTSFDPDDIFINWCVFTCFFGWSLCRYYNIMRMNLSRIWPFYREQWGVFFKHFKDILMLKKTHLQLKNLSERANIPHVPTLSLEKLNKCEKQNCIRKNNVS